MLWFVLFDVVYGLLWSSFCFLVAVRRRLSRPAAGKVPENPFCSGAE
jgi:hypothetical protein